MNAETLDEPGIAPYIGDELLVEAVRRDGLPHHSVHRPERMAIVLGKGSLVQREVLVDACRADAIPVQRRAGGGCAVLIDPGNLVVSVALPVNGLGSIRRQLDIITGWFVDTLEAMGFTGLSSDGISDLVLGDRKVSGSAMYRCRDLLTWGATLLFRPDVESMERYLNHPPREPAYRRGRSHRDFVASLAPGQSDADLESWRVRLHANLDPSILLRQLHQSGAC